MRRIVLTLLMSVTLSGCNIAGCVANHLVDGGIPSADDVAFDETMGDPAPLYDGGTTMYGGFELDTTIDGVQRTLTVSNGGDPIETWVFAHGDDSDVTGTGDNNQDGKIDYQYRSVLTGTTVDTTELEDTDFDGVFDRKHVTSVDISGAIPWPRTETMSVLQNGAFVDQWTWSGIGEANASAPGAASARSDGCNGNLGFPDGNPFDLSTVLVRNPATLIRIIVDDGSKHVPGACTQEQAARLVTGFQMALEDIAGCSAVTRAHLASAVKTAVQKNYLFVGCGNPCTDYAASTDLPYSSGAWQDWNAKRPDGYQRMNVNPAAIFQAGPLWVEETLLHELIHFAGFNHTPPPYGQPDGHDMVYGCGRYCVRGGLQGASKGGCQSDPGGAATGGWGNGVPTAQQYAFDCADCANEANRPICGEGLLRIPSCSNADCQYNASLAGCDPGTTCCHTIVLNCWGNGATGGDVGNRNPEAIPRGEGACLQSGCMANGDPSICHMGDPVNPIPANSGAKVPCMERPVGWCTK